jgi:hypothetical protein
MSRSPFRSKFVIAVIAAVFIFVSLAWINRAYAQSNSLQGLREFLGSAIDVQKRHNNNLFATPDVVGTAVGLTENGAPAIKVYKKSVGIMGIPTSLEGIPVIVEETGEFHAFPASQKGGSPNSSRINTASPFTRPVPIGVSTGNQGECSAGTIGARVKDSGGNIYALSNNHVYALENNAPLNSSVLQPGLYDTQCSVDSNNVIGSLSKFAMIVFSSSASNTVDAAIAVSNVSLLGNSTPPNGYGTPQSATVSAFVGQNVMKYGRTSSLTTGQITGINGTVLVTYSSGTARFVNQIIVGSSKPFIKAGDSGSLLVTTSSANPVGLLFAGTSSGKTAIANPIDLVEAALGVTIDGQ